METSEVVPRSRLCSICMEHFSDTTPSYCRKCTNAYYRWRYRQQQKGLPYTIAEYKKVFTAFMEEARDSPWRDPKSKELTPYKDCPICLGTHRNPHSSYCPVCKIAYEAWSRGQKETYDASNGLVGRAHPTVEEFRCMVYDMGLAGKGSRPQVQ
jgi:hypothetical protein